MLRSSLLPALLLLGLVFGACSDEEHAPPPPIDDDDELHDPLSMPREPTLEIDAFQSAQECGACHTTHYEQWRSSIHAYAMQDPIFRALVEIRRDDFQGKHDQFCTQCHSAIGTRGGDCVKDFSFSNLNPVVLEGVTCEACHKVKSVERLYNSGHVLDPNGPIRGTIQDPMTTPVHDSEYSELHGSADFCGGCHDVVEYTGLNLERPYSEFVESPGAAQGENCQTCHMPTYMGRATPDAPVRELHDHRFIAVGQPLVDGFADQDTLNLRRERIVELLQSAATLSLEAPPSVHAGEQIDLLVSIKNEIDAHNFPTGSTFNRQVWVEVIATDGTGAVLFQTGVLDENGDLKDYFSETEPFADSDLLALGSGFIDDRGNPTIFPWKASEHISSSISPLYVRTNTLFVPTSSAASGPITVSARLRFRTFRPHILRALDLEDYTEKLEVYDVDTATLDIGLD